MTPAQFHTLLIEHGLDQPGQIEAAKALGVHPRTVRHWLNGDRHIPLMVTRLFELRRQIIELHKQVKKQAARLALQTDTGRP